MNTNLNDYLKDIMPTTQTVTTMDFGPFVSDYSCGCKSDETKLDRRGWKRRMVLEALTGMEITSVRKMHQALKEKGIEVSIRTVAYAIQSLQGSCAKPNTQSNYNYIDNNIVRSHNHIAQTTPVKSEDNVLRLLTEGKTIQEISKLLKMSDKTVKKHIKKAKQEGLITNMGSDKYPKWTMLSEQSNASIPEGNDLKNENDVVQTTPVKTESKITQENISKVIKSLKSIDEYLYYTGEGKDKFDEWFDFSLANS